MLCHFVRKDFIIFPVGVMRREILHWYLILLFQFTAQCCPDVILSKSVKLISIRCVYDHEQMLILKNSLNLFMTNYIHVLSLKYDRYIRKIFFHMCVTGLKIWWLKKNVDISLLIAEFKRCWFVTNEMSP